MVIVVVCPADNAVVAGVTVSVGRTVSMAIDGVMPAPPVFPAASV